MAEHQSASMSRETSLARRAWSGTLAVAGKVFVWSWVVFTCALLAWLILAAFKTNDTVFRAPFALPESISFENFGSAWGLLNLGRTFPNTVMVVGFATVLTVALAAPAAYGLTRFRFRGVALLTLFFAVGIGIPAQSILIPLFLGLSKVGLSNSLIGLTLVYVGIALPFAVFLLTAFFAALPSDLEEAAAIDGAGPIRTFMTVMLPLARPGLITTAIITAVALWNEYLLALTLIIDPQKKTLSLSLLNTYGAMRYTSDWVGLFAAVVIILVPMVIVYMLLSRKILAGMTFGASK